MGVTWSGIWGNLGITPSGVVGVIIATTIIYLVFTAILIQLGPRLMAGGTAVTVALVSLFGALSARSMLGNAPTLCGGLVALTVLFLLESFLRRGTHLIHSKTRSRHHKGAIVVVADGRIIDDAARSRGLTNEALIEKLRACGIKHLDDVAGAILETRGSLTVIRRDETIDADFLNGVQHADLLPRSVTDH